MIVELFQHIPTPSSEEPEAILVLITKLDEIYAFSLDGD